MSSDRSCFPLQTSSDYSWSESCGVIEKLRSPDNNFESLVEALNKLHSIRNSLPPRVIPFTSLFHAINSLFPDPTVFYRRVLPFIAEKALELTRWNKTLPVLTSDKEGKVSIERQEVLSILANSFLLNHQHLRSFADPTWCHVDWKKLYILSDNSIAVELIKCFLQYFVSAEAEWSSLEDKTTFLPGCITIERVLAPKFHPHGPIQCCRVPFEPEDVKIHTCSMDDPYLDVVGSVAFSGADVLGGCLHPSATQEDILFASRPELYVATLLVQRLGERDAVVFNGAPKICETAGFSSSFRLVGPVSDIHRALTTQTFHLIYAMDACTCDQFANMGRDSFKAYSAFLHARRSVPSGTPVMISTGNWGCGSFGGDKMFKFLQQIMAAKAAGIRLAFSAYGDVEYARQLQALFDSIVAHGWHPYDVWEVCHYSSLNCDVKNFHQNMCKNTGIEWTF